MFISIVLKGVVYKIRYEQKRNKQEDYAKINEEINRKKAELKKLMDERKTIMVDMLSERQLIIFKNPYNKNLGSEELKNDERYLKQQELLKAYDDVHGTYIEPV